MVENLKQRFRQSGVALPLEKHAGTVYRLGAKKLCTLHATQPSNPGLADP